MSQRSRYMPYNALRENGGSVVRSVEPHVLAKLELEPGDAPKDIEVDEEARELTLSF